MAKTLATKSSKMRPQLTEKEKSMGSYPGPMTRGWEDVVAETLITRGSCKKPPKRDIEECTTQKLPMSNCIESIQDNTDCSYFGIPHI